MQQLLNQEDISLEYEVSPGDPSSQMTGSTLPNTQNYYSASGTTPITSQG